MKYGRINFQRDDDAKENKGGGAGVATGNKGQQGTQGQNRGTGAGSQGSGQQGGEGQGFNASSNFQPSAEEVRLQNAPKKVEWACTITNITAPITHEKGDYQLIQATGQDGTRRNISINPAFLFKNKKLLKEGADVVLTLERHIENTTDYIKKDGTRGVHTSDRDNITNVVKQTMSERLKQFSDNPALMSAMAKIYQTEMTLNAGSRANDDE